MMPKLTRTPSQHQHRQHPYAPAPLSIPVTLASTSSTMPYYTSRSVSDYYTSSAAQAPMSVPSYDPYAVAPMTMSAPPVGGPVGSTVGGPVGGPGPLPTQHRASSGAWAPQDDQMLLSARAQGHNWNQIQSRYFPGKTGNACRKRHERLMERKGADDWDTRKLERLSKEYMSLRKEIWAPLAQRCGEKWNVVEQKCMSNGLKNIQSHARAYARRERLESGQPLTGYDDDSGISGIGLDGVDVDGVDDLGDDTYSSPETTSSGGANGSAVGSNGNGQQSYGGTAMHSTGSYQGYSYSNPQHHQYTPSVSSQGTAGYHQHTTSQGSSPYMGHGNRLPSVGDMGINAIINQGPTGSNGATNGV